MLQRMGGARVALLLASVAAPAFGLVGQALAAASDGSPSAVEEVVVTAQKRSENILNVPMAVSALAGDKLASSASFRFSDYVEKVPGVTLIDSGSIGAQLVVRGLSIGSAQINAPVATYLDETPFTVVGPFAGSASQGANLDTFDLQRVEVLRGPQGTLYGSNALGGLLKYVTNAPELGRVGGTLEAGVNSVAHGGVGGDVHGAVNLPIGDKAALRIVGYDTYYAGYVDNTVLGKDVNDGRNEGGRISFLVKPTDNLSIRLSALFQKRSWSDGSAVEVTPLTFQPIYGELTSAHPLAQPGKQTNQLYNLTINYDFGPAKLMSSSSYGRDGVSSVADESAIYGAILGPIFGIPVVGLKLNDPVNFVVQELRLSSNTTGPLQWQMGGYFAFERAHEFEGIYPGVAGTSDLITDFPIPLGTFVITPDYREYAVFGDVDYHVTQTIDIQFGGRWSHNDQTYHQIGFGALAGSTDFITHSQEGVFTYSADARWKPTPDIMFYARVASGFAPGGPNDVIPNSSLPSEFLSSKTVNYEVGVKGHALNGRLTAEIDAFDIEWSRIQLQAVIGGLSSIVNGGTARSDGFEWALGYMPLDGLSLNFTGAYVDARLTEDGPASVMAFDGDRLAQAPKWSGSVSADYRHPLSANLTGSIGADWRFASERWQDFVPVGPRQVLPSYSMFDLRAGVEVSSYRIDLYVKNVADKRVINSAALDSLAYGFGPQNAVYYQPRTIGASVTATW